MDEVDAVIARLTAELAARDAGAVEAADGSDADDGQAQQDRQA
jgi:hypothetical protein